MSATEIVDLSNKVLRRDSSHTKMSMTIVTSSWSRTLDVEAWTLHRDKALIVIHAPPKDRGTTTLRRGSEMWLWLPKADRVMKIPASMMHSAWQGSDFTYEDIVKADSIVKDYTHKITAQAAQAEGTRVTIEATPKPGAPVVWGKVMLASRVYPDNWVVPLSEEDYNERGQLVRSIRLSEIKPMEGKLVPTRLVCQPTKDLARRTQIDYHEIQFQVDTPDSFFSLSRLQQEGK